MKNYNYKRVGTILEYINSSKEKVEPLEIIGKFIPSLYELNIVYNKTLKGKYHNIRIDMQSKELKGAIRKSYELREELDFSENMILQYLDKKEKKMEFKEGDKVNCIEYGKGTIVQLCEFDLMIVKFDNRKFNVMCSQKGYTVHDAKKRKVVKC